MKYKHYLYINGLMLLLLLSHLTVAQELTVDLSQIQAFGIQSNKVQINNIIVKVVIPDPLIPNSTQEVILPPYNLPFKACQFENGLVQLIPLLEPEEPDCYIEGVDFTQSRGFARDVNGVQLNHIQFQTTIVDPIDPNRIEIINTTLNSVFRFESATLNLVQSFEPIITPTQVKISLRWSDYQADLDAHLLAPIMPYSQERFHLYFGEKANDVAILNNGEYPFEIQEEIVTILPSQIEPPSRLRPGIYTYVVQYFRGISNMFDSGAVVSLQVGNEPEQVFTPPPPLPPNDVEELFDNNFRENSMENWVVFELQVADDGMVTVVPRQNYNGVDVIF
ncbi:secreted protein [Beggiatoa sp. PS]|nr:secreted protein [Beggiatoa sp. PS]